MLDPITRRSPDGSMLVLRTAVLSAGGGTPGARDLHQFRPGSNASTTPLVATSQYAEQDPSISPDGRWLAYTSNETGRNEVFVRPFPDVEAGKVQVSTSGGEAPLWSHDGTELFYLDGTGNLVAARFTTTSSFRVTTQSALFSLPARIVRAQGTNTIDITPDGQRFLMGRSMTAGGTPDDADVPRLVLMKNFAEELRQRVPR